MEVCSEAALPKLACEHKMNRDDNIHRMHVYVDMLYIQFLWEPMNCSMDSETEAQRV